MKKQNPVLSVFLGILAIAAGMIAQMIGQVIVLVIGIAKDIVGLTSGNDAGSYSEAVLKITEELVNKPYYSIALVVGEVFMFILCFAWYVGAYRKHDVGPVKSVSLKVIGLAFAAGFCFQIGTSALLNWSFAILPDFIGEGYAALSQNFIGSISLGYILFIAVLGPITEELLCRGVVFGLLKQGLSTKASIFGSAILFGLMHLGNTMNLATFIGSLIQALYTFLLGVFLGYVRVKFKSVCPTMLIHIVCNASAYVLILIPESFAYDHIVLINVLEGVLGAGLAVLTYFIYKKTKPVSELTKAEAALDGYTD